MNTFQQRCPSCSATLELPIAARGRESACPACGQRFVAEEVELLDRMGLAPDKETVGETFPIPRPIEHIESVSIEGVVVDAREAFSTRKRPLLVPFLVPSVLVLVVIVFPLAGLSDLAGRNGLAAAIWAAILSPLWILVAGYAVWFALNLATDVCDAGVPDDPDHVPPIRSWWIPNGRIFFAVLTCVCFGVIGAVLLTCLSTILFQVSLSLPAVELRLLFSAVAVVGSIGVGLGVAMRLWPCLVLAMDGRLPWHSFRDALAITRSNQMTSFLLMTISVVMVGVGFAFLGLGLPLAIPAVALLLVVALRRILNWRIPAIDEPLVPEGT